MEHRHFARKPHHRALQLMTRSGKIYPAQMLDLSAIGMRVITSTLLPEGEKVLDVLLSETDNRFDPTFRMRMFVAHKAGREIGLCLLNEGMKIDVDSWRQDHSASALRKVAGY
jgi:hypothetical protein